MGLLLSMIMLIIPVKLSATLSAAKQRVETEETQQRVIAIFQPHRYSRTQYFYSGICYCF